MTDLRPRHQFPTQQQQQQQQISINGALSTPMPLLNHSAAGMLRPACPKPNTKLPVCTPSGGQAPQQQHVQMQQQTCSQPLQSSPSLAAVVTSPALPNGIMHTPGPMLPSASSQLPGKIEFNLCYYDNILV